MKATFEPTKGGGSAIRIEGLGEVILSSEETLSCIRALSGGNSFELTVEPPKPAEPPIPVAGSKPRPKPSAPTSFLPVLLTDNEPWPEPDEFKILPITRTARGRADSHDYSAVEIREALYRPSERWLTREDKLEVHIRGRVGLVVAVDNGKIVSIFPSYEAETRYRKPAAA